MEKPANTITREWCEAAAENEAHHGDADCTTGVGLWPEAARDAADADVLGELQAYVRHNSILPSDHVGDGRVVPLSLLRGWIQRERNRRTGICGALALEAERQTIRRTLDAVQRDIENHLYTNTKSGNRQLMLNVVARVRVALLPSGQK